VAENLPKSSLYYRHGLKFHIGETMYGLKIVGLAWRERPTIVVVDSGTTHWLVLSLLSFLRIPVIAVMHSTLWPKGFPPKRKVDRLFHATVGLFFRRFASATICVSPECERQVQTVAGFTKGPIYQCRAQFRQGFLDSVDPVPAHGVRPLRVLFVGRVEESKGVFLIVSVAERLEKEMPGQFSWKIVGTGSALEALSRQVADRKLGGVIDVAGRLSRKDAMEAYGWAHANIVPTTATYAEGLAMTAAEAVLAGRPVVVSEVVPAWEVLGDAAIRVETGNVDGFVDAFRRLALDAAWYDHCRRATVEVRKQFYDSSQGLGVMIGKAIVEIEGSNTKA
jgi:glycosyltransferase involved in cell wall biosynthesis